MKKILIFGMLSIISLSMPGCMKSTIDYAGLLTLLASKSGIPAVRGAVNNTYMKNILTVYSIPDRLIVATAEADLYGRWELYVPPGDYDLQLYSANPMTISDAASPRELYQISQYELSVGSDGKSMVKGVDLSQSNSFLTSFAAGRAMTISTDNFQYLLYSRLMSGTYVEALYGAGNTDVYAVFSYGANNKVSNMREHLGTDATGTLYSDTMVAYNGAGSVATIIVNNYITPSSSNNTVYAYEPDGIRISSMVKRDGTVTGSGTELSRVTYTYDALSRLAGIQLDDWVTPSSVTLAYAWNTDDTMSSITMTSGTSDFDYIFTYTGPNITQLDVNDKIGATDIRATYTMNANNLPSGSQFSTGTYPSGPWTVAGTGIYVYEPTFGLLDSYAYGSESYAMTYDTRGKQLSVIQDRTGTANDFCTLVTYDANGNISTAVHYTALPIGTPVLTITFTWQAI